MKNIKSFLTLSVVCMIAIIAILPSAAIFAENTTYETALSISASIDGDSLIQYVNSASVEDGPADILAADDESFYILNAMGDNILYYENGSLADTIDIAHCYVPVNLCLIGDKLYVLDGSSVWQYDTVTKNWREYPIPAYYDEEPYYDYVCDMVVEESCIVLFSEKYGNLILNEDTGTFEPTDLGYYSTRIGDNVIIIRNDRQWVLNMPRVSTQVICFDDNGSVYVEAIDLKLNEYDRGYCTVRKYSESGKLLGICPVNTTAWNNTPDKFAEIGADGSVYILSPEYDATRILKTALGGNASVIGTFPAVVNGREKPVLPEEEYMPMAGRQYGTRPVTLSRNEVFNRANQMANLKWTYKRGHDNKDANGKTRFAHVQLPEYLTYKTEEEEKKLLNSTQVGIPYCRGGFNGCDTVEEYVNGQLVYTDTAFSDAAKETTGSGTGTIQKYVTGNTDSNYGYNSNTIGLDCSGFVSSAYGADRKANTSMEYNSSDFVTIGEMSSIDLSSLQLMDMIVRSGQHVMLFHSIKDASKYQFWCYESTTSAIPDNPSEKYDKVAHNYRTQGAVKNYWARRPASWYNCKHTSVSSSYLGDATYHWKTCNTCGAKVSITKHSLIADSNGGYICKVCHMQFSSAATNLNRLVPDILAAISGMSFNNVSDVEALYDGFCIMERKDNPLGVD